MEQLPQDPFMLLSYINTQLRDNYATLNELCTSLDVSRDALVTTLRAAGFEYDAANNRFW